MRTNRHPIPRPRRQPASASTPCHLFISVLGFETRAIFAATTLASLSPQRVALAFPDRKLFSYGSNARWYNDNGFETVQVDDPRFRDFLVHLISSVPVAHDQIDIRVDISSMSRPLLAELLICLSAIDRQLTVQFVYCPGQFTSPEQVVMPAVNTGPVIPEFAGWWDRPDLPTAVVLGLGFEYGRALGAFEFLEASDAWLFAPSGEDGRYEVALRRVNKDLWSMLPEQRVQEYRVDDPFSCFSYLESLVYGLRGRARTVLVPFGPKIFSLCCLIVALTHRGDVAVWRVSGEQSEVPIDRAANGKVVQFDVEFG